MTMKIKIKIRNNSLYKIKNKNAFFICNNKKKLKKIFRKI